IRGVGRVGVADPTPATHPPQSKASRRGNYAVNTMQPSWQPSAFGVNVLPGVNDVDPSKPFYETNIGDELSAKNVSWNWYAGGWNDAAAGHADPLFQFHHQPLNYFQNYAPGMPGRTHLRDETEF